MVKRRARTAMAGAASLVLVLGSCTTSTPRSPPSEPARAPQATRVPEASKPAPKTVFDVQAVVQQQLARGASFYGLTSSESGAACSDQSFLDPTPEGSAVRFGPDEWMFLHSGSFQTARTPGQIHEFHGYSAVSVLDRGHELFFSLEDCRRAGMRDEPKSTVVDFAEQFWKYDAPLYAPVFGALEVSCQELTRRTSSTGLLEYRVHSDGLALSVALVRTPSGFELTRSEPRFVVHGRDKQAFLINGSPWFLHRDDCLLQLSQSKPVNLGLYERAVAQYGASAAPPTRASSEPPGSELTLRSEYYAVEWPSPVFECLHVTLTPVVASMGRLVIERPGGSVAYNYDYYPAPQAFWLTRVGRYPTDSLDPLAGHVLWVTSAYSGITVGDGVWYDTEAECASGLRGKAL